MKYIKWLIPLIVVVILVNLVIYGFIAKNVPTNEVKNVTITEEDGQLHFKGSFNHPKYRYVDHNFRVKNNQVYISVKAALFVGDKGNFDFTIKPERGTTLKTVILTGDQRKDERPINVEK